MPWCQINADECVSAGVPTASKKVEECRKNAGQTGYSDVE
jgi:hypothetical protein